jgi:hypothetical protein
MVEKAKFTECHQDQTAGKNAAAPTLASQKPWPINGAKIKC